MSQEENINFLTSPKYALVWLVVISKSARSLFSVCPALAECT